jgi:peptidoglycan/LPS O-acetylase OafA/YrhL
LGILSKPNLGHEDFPALTGIRAVAVFMAFFHHLPLRLWADFFIGLQLSFFSAISLFFVLSGFLITYRYYNAINISRSFLYTYFVKRIARILPVYFLVLTIVILIIKTFDPIFLIQNYTLTHNLIFLFDSHGMAIPPSWSLSVEESFYILAPVIFFLTRKFNLIVPFVFVLMILTLILLTYGGESSFMDSTFSVVYSSFFGHSIEFFAGIYLALMILKKKEKNFYSKGSAKTILGSAGIIACLILLVYVTNKEDDFKYRIMLLGNNFLLAFPIITLYYGLIYEKTWLRNFLSHPFMRLFGRSSYAFYLIHFPLIHFFARPYLLPFFSEGSYNLFVLLVFVITLLLSVAIYIFYEAPMNSLVQRIFGVVKKNPL